MILIPRRRALLGLAATLAVPRPGGATGLNPALLGRALDTAGSLEPLRSLIVAKNGRIIAERRFSGPPTDRPVNVKSVSKAVIAALTGIAIARGMFTGTDQTITPLLADKLPADPDPRLHRITLDHLLSMRAGLEGTSGVNYGPWVTSRDWVRHVLSRPFVAEPGGPMLYSTGNSHLLSAALARASGRSTLALARAWVGEPLGIAVLAWPRDPQGIYFGGNDMLLSPRCCAWRRCTGWAACWTAPYHIGFHRRSARLRLVPSRVRRAPAPLRLGFRRPDDPRRAQPRPQHRHDLGPGAALRRRRGSCARPAWIGGRDAHASRNRRPGSITHAAGSPSG